MFLTYCCNIDQKRFYGLVSVTRSSWESDVSVTMEVANSTYHGSCMLYFGLDVFSIWGPRGLRTCNMGTWTSCVLERPEEQVPAGSRFRVGIK